MIAACPNYPRHEEEKHHKEEKQKKIRNQHVRLFREVTVVNGVAGSLVFASRCLEDRINSFGQPALIIVVSKVRLDPMLGNVECREVGQRAFQAVTDLNEHLSVLDEHEQHDAVALIFLPHAPGLRDALRVRGDVVVALHFWKHRDHNLVRSFAFELGELIVKTAGRVFRNYARVIVEVSRRFLRNDFGGRYRVCSKQKRYNEMDWIARPSRALVSVSRRNKLLKSARLRDAIANTRDACATQNSCAHSSDRRRFTA